MKKKIIILLLSSLLLTSCGTQKETKSTKNTTTAVASTKNVAQEADYSDYPNEAVLKGKKLDGMMPGVYRPQNYTKFFRQEKYKKFLHTDIKEWKDAQGNYGYPQDYTQGPNPNQPDVLASQQFPESLLKDISTKDLLHLILDKVLYLAYYDQPLEGLSLFRSDYNFVDELMNRKDCNKYVEKEYASYSKKERKKYSTSTWTDYFSDKGDNFEESQKFQFVEALKEYYAKK